MPTNRELRQQLVDAVRFKSNVDWIFFAILDGIVIISWWIFTIWDSKVYYFSQTKFVLILV